MTVNMAMESTLGMMASNMRDGGRMVSNMERVSTEKTAEIEEVFGKMERESNGLTRSSGEISETHTNSHKVLTTDRKSVV